MSPDHAAGLRLPVPPLGLLAPCAEWWGGTASMLGWCSTQACIRYTTMLQHFRLQRYGPSACYLDQHQCEHHLRGSWLGLPGGGGLCQHAGVVQQGGRGSGRLHRPWAVVLRPLL